MSSSSILNSVFTLYITHLLHFLTIFFFLSLPFPFPPLPNLRWREAARCFWNAKTKMNLTWVLRLLSLEYLNEINDAGRNSSSLTSWSAKSHVELSLRGMTFPAASPLSCGPAAPKHCLMNVYFLQEVKRQAHPYSSGPKSTKTQVFPSNKLSALSPKVSGEALRLWQSCLPQNRCGSVLPASAPR